MRILIYLFLLFTAPQVMAQNTALVARLAPQQVYLSTAFDGARVLLFGAIDSDLAPVNDDLDVAIVLTGGTQNYVLRPKQKRFGLWVNSTQARTLALPSFYAIATNRSLSAIAPFAQRQQHRLGVDTLGAGAEAQAVQTLQREAGLYNTATSTVQIINNQLFSAEFTLPPNAPIGSYDAGFYLIHKGRVLGERHQNLVVAPAGMMQQLRNLATSNAVLYGVLAVLLAALLGGASAVLFGRR